MYAYEWDVATDTVVRSSECASLLGAGSVTHTTRKELINWVHPDDHGLCGDLSTVSPQNPTLRARYRIARQDGTWMWAEKSARAFFDEQGKMVRMIGMIVDISERKLAEEALSSVSRRLIEAQEQERAHIARELHDDLSQRMALIEIGLEQVAQNIPDLTSGAREQLHNISEVAWKFPVASTTCPTSCTPRSLTSGSGGHRGELLPGTVRPAGSEHRVFPSQRQRANPKGCNALPVSHRTGSFTQRREAQRGLGSQN